MTEERTLDTEPKSSEQEQSKEQEAPEAESAQEALDDDVEDLVTGLEEDAAKRVRTLAKKAKDFDKMVESKKAAKPAVDMTEDKVRSVLHKENEQAVIKAVVKEGDPMYIPELVDDKNWHQVLGYLPRNVDRSSKESVHRALKLAVRSWKDDNGIEDKAKGRDAASDLVTSKRTGSGAQAKATNGGRKLLRQERGIDTWFNKE